MMDVGSPYPVCIVLYCIVLYCMMDRSWCDLITHNMILLSLHLSVVSTNGTRQGTTGTTSTTTTCRYFMLHVVCVVVCSGQFPTRRVSNRNEHRFDNPVFSFGVLRTRDKMKDRKVTFLELITFGIIKNRDVVAFFFACELAYLAQKGGG